MTIPNFAWRRILWPAIVGDARKTVRATTIALLLFATVGGLFGALLSSDRLLGACRGSGLMLALLGGFYWLRFASGAATQNSPANAHLVPRLTSQVRATAVLAWLLTLALMLPFCFSSALGPVSFVLLGMGVTGVGMYRAGREDGLMAAVLVLLVYVAALNWPPLRLMLGSAPALATGLGASLAFGWFGLRAAFPRGGEAHWALLDGQRRASALDNLSNWDEVLTKDGRRNRLYSFLLKRYARTEQGKRKLLLMGLGPGMHSFHYGYVLLIAVVLGLLVEPVAIWLALPVENLAHNIGRTLMGGVIGIACAGAARFGTTIRATPGEQALLMLTPGLPRKAVLTRTLGRRILGSCLAEWSVATVVILALVAVWGGDRGAYQITATLMVTCLIAAGTSLDDYARKADVSIVGLVLLGLLVFALFIASVIMVESLLAWAILLLALLGVAAMTTWVRWRAMRDAPVAFPAQRLA